MSWGHFEFVFGGRGGFMPLCLWNSQSTLAQEEAEAAMCQALRAGWRPATSVFDDLADDLEVLVREDWNPARSVRYAGHSTPGAACQWDGVPRTRPRTSHAHKCRFCGASHQKRYLCDAAARALDAMEVVS